MENCVVCLVQFCPSDQISLVTSTDKDEESRNRKKINLIYRKILRIFCTYFNLPCKQNDSENDNVNEEERESLCSLPFCVECRNLVAELCIFHDQIESIQKFIGKTIAKITTKIINTEIPKDCENYSNSHSDQLETQNQENGLATGKKTIFGYRQTILQNFNPRVHLTDCRSQIEKSQKQVATKTTNEINFTVTEIEDVQDFNGEDCHDNINDDVDVDIDADVKIEEERSMDDSTAEISENLSSHSLSDEVENDNLQLNMNSNSVSVDEKTGENLMQRIRTKFKSNRKSNCPPLQNPSAAKDSSDLSSNADNGNGDLNQNQKSLEDKMHSDTIESLGDGKFLYKKCWPFHVIDNSEFFQCDTCQTKYGFYKYPKAKIYTDIIYHIAKEHMSLSNNNNNNNNNVKQNVEDGKFQFVDKYAFENNPDSHSLNSENCDFQSDKDNKIQNRNRKSLEDEMRSDAIESVGDGKFLYKKSWPFHIIDDSEFFQCDTCQSKYGVYKTPNNRIYAGVIRHIAIEHMSWSKKKNNNNNVKQNVANGKFQFLDKCSFEKVDLGFKCGHCPKIYTKILSLKSHIQLWHMPGEFQCTKCPRSYRTRESLRKHTCFGNQEIRNQTIEVSPGKFIYNGKKQKWEFELINGIFQCGSCPANRKAKDRITDHICRSHDSLAPQMCDECGKVFMVKYHLTLHKRGHLRKAAKAETPKSQSSAVCPTCGKMFKSSAGLGVHITRIHKENHVAMTTTTIQQEDQGNPSDLKYSCGKCGMKFLSPVRLKKHEENCTQLICPNCGKQFKCKQHFQAHVDRHNKVYKFFCDVCNKGFLQKWQVARHKETGAHSQKDETTKSKEKSMYFNATAQKQKGKRKQREAEESSEEESSEEESAVEDNSQDSEQD